MTTSASCRAASPDFCRHHGVFAIALNQRDEAAKLMDVVGVYEAERKLIEAVRSGYDAVDDRDGSDLSEGFQAALEHARSHYANKLLNGQADHRSMNRAFDSLGLKNSRTIGFLAGIVESERPRTREEFKSVYFEKHDGENRIHSSAQKLAAATKSDQEMAEAFLLSLTIDKTWKSVYILRKAIALAAEYLQPFRFIPAPSDWDGKYGVDIVAFADGEVVWAGQIKPVSYAIKDVNGKWAAGYAKNVTENLAHNAAFKEKFGVDVGWLLNEDIEAGAFAPIDPISFHSEAHRSELRSRFSRGSKTVSTMPDVPEWFANLAAA